MTQATTASRPDFARNARRLLGRRTTALGRAVRKNPNLGLGLLILAFVVLVSLLAPVLQTHDPIRTAAFDRFTAPSREFFFGTDQLGRDIYSRTVHGGRISLAVAAGVVAIVTTFGMTLGMLSGYIRLLDSIIMRFMDGLLAIPTLVLALALIALLGPSIQNVVIAISVAGLPGMVRVCRSSVLSLRDRMYVEAARAAGVPVWRILLFHIAPNTLAPVTVQATFIFAAAIITEASLSFLGAGTPSYIPTWGNIIGLGRDYMQSAFWIIFFPGMFLVFTVMAVNLVGDGLRDALDPRLRNRVGSST